MMADGNYIAIGESKMAAAHDETHVIMGESKMSMQNIEKTMEEPKVKPGLLRIPNEIIRQVGGYLSEKGDMAAFVRTCRLLNDMFGDVLYQQDQKYHKYKQDSCLTWAAARDKVDTLKRAVKAGIRLEDHSHLIFVVSCNGSPKCAELVLSTPGINLMGEDEQRWTPITLAAMFGHANVVKKLIEHGANYTALTTFGWSPFDVACCHGNLGVARLLLDDYGVSMDGDYGNNWGPLRSACTFGHADIVAYLLQRGANTASEAGAWTCLHVAADGGHTKVVEALLSHGFDPSVVADESGWTAFALAIDRRHYDTVEAFLEKGVDIEQKCTGEWTPLCMAADRGDLRMATILLGRGASVMTKAVGGWTPITLAASKGFWEVTNLLLSYRAGAHMNILSGWTPLMAASDGGHAALAEILLDSGADMQTSNSTGWNSLICAADGHQLVAPKMLLSHGADIMDISAGGYTPGIRAAYAESHRLLNMFLKTHGFQLDHLDNLDCSAFFHAAVRGHAKMIKNLLPSTNAVNTRGKYGPTPIFAATRNGHGKVVELLVNEGFADFAERGLLYFFLLAHAQRSKRRQFVKYLRRYSQQANAPISLEDSTGKRSQRDDCDGGMVLCPECIAAGQTCSNVNHQGLWNDDFGSMPPLLRTGSTLRQITEVDDDGNAVEDVEDVDGGDGNDGAANVMMMGN